MQLTVARYARRPGSLSSASRSCQTRCIATFVLIPGAGTDPLVYTATIEALSAVKLLVADRSIRVIDLNGELIRELTLDPSRDYQPLARV